MWKATLHRRAKEGFIKPHTHAIKSYLTDANKRARLKFCLSMFQSGTNEDNGSMEKFYALINNIREARDRLISNNVLSTAAAANDQGETMKRKLEEDREKQAVAWNPSFQREDFMDEADNKEEPHMSFASTSQNKEGNDRKEEVKEELDLTLSLQRDETVGTSK